VLGRKGGGGEACKQESQNQRTHEIPHQNESKQPAIGRLGYFRL
jgi:hypothetical protein